MVNNGYLRLEYGRHCKSGHIKPHEYEVLIAQQITLALDEKA